MFPQVKLLPIPYCIIPIGKYAILMFIKETRSGRQLRYAIRYFKTMIEVDHLQLSLQCRA